MITVGLEAIGDQSAGQLLEDAGIADAWRDEVEQQINLIARDFIKTAFPCVARRHPHRVVLSVC